MYIEPESSTLAFSEKYKAVFLKYCQTLRSHGHVATQINKKIIYQEVAEALFYKSTESVAYIIRTMLRAGYRVKDDIDTRDINHRLDELEKMRNEQNV